MLICFYWIKTEQNQLIYSFNLSKERLSVRAKLSIGVLWTCLTRKKLCFLPNITLCQAGPKDSYGELGTYREPAKIDFFSDFYFYYLRLIITNYDNHYKSASYLSSFYAKYKYSLKKRIIHISYQIRRNYVILRIKRW